MTLLQLVLVLFLVLAAALLVRSGFIRRRRLRRLGHLAELQGLRAAGRDFMGLPARYAKCLLMQSGHSAYAENLLFGRTGNCFLRAFDLRFEAGHGPQRQSCLVTVVAAETMRARPSVAIWRDEPAAAALLCMENLAAGQDGWIRVGDEATAEELAAAWPAQLRPVTLLTAGKSILAACPGQLAQHQLADWLHAMVAWVGKLERAS